MRTTKGLAAIAGQSESEAHLLAMVVALTSELAVLRARQDAMERIVAAAGVMPAGAVDGFIPSPDAATARQAARERLLRKVFRPFLEADKTSRDPALRTAEVTR